jgi:hypothetical protein
MADDPTKYGVAISFLAADEKIAEALYSQLPGLNVFFFPRKQEELIGTDGLESMRQPFIDATVVVVLFRAPWGNTRWTGIEKIAITDRCLQQQFRPLVFVQLEKGSKLPSWLPETHVRCVFEDYGIEQLAGAIKLRVQELGGVIKKETAIDHARRVALQSEYYSDRTNLLRDHRWIQSVHASIQNELTALQLSVDEVNLKHSLGIQIAIRDRTCVMRYKYVSLLVIWQQPIFNRIDDEHGECNLLLREYTGLTFLQGEGYMPVATPSLLREHKLRPDVTQARELMWIDRSSAKGIGIDGIANHIMMIFLDFISRVDRDEVPKPEW